jgi:hypothetical protein|tara:strand:- start:225 stop:821 length:597 start_codon:yes stop_codon:yes gene_type:complete
MKELNQKLATIQTKFKSKKSRFNSFGKYYFRSAEDILEATKPFLLELGVSVTINEKLTVQDPPILSTTATISDGENSITATAVVGVDLAQKGMQMPQKFGAASSYAKKYALGNLFLIDDTQDSDASNDHGNGVVSKLKEKAKVNITIDQFKKAKLYVNAGGKVSAIETKYKLNKGQKEELIELENGQKTETEDPYYSS